MQQIYTGLKK